MTLHVYVRCDAAGCAVDEPAPDALAPEGWAVVLGPAFSNLPTSLHFCPAHVDSPAHLEAMRRMRGVPPGS